MAKRIKKKVQSELTFDDFDENFIDEFIEKWINWLEDTTYVNESGATVFRKEIPKTTYFQFLTYYKSIHSERATLPVLEELFIKNEYFRNKMKEIDMIYESLLEMYMSNNKISAISAKFMFTNKYKNNWEDSKTTKSHNITEKIVWNETLYLDAEPAKFDPYSLDESPIISTKKSKSKSKLLDDDFDFENL